MKVAIRFRRALALSGVTLCATVGVMLATGAGTAGATSIVRNCGGAYTVTVPANRTPVAGEDPEETAAANCTIGYHEKKGYPFSLIALVLATTVLTLLLLHWKRNALDLGWSEDDSDVSPDLAGGAV